MIKYIIKNLKTTISTNRLVFILLIMCEFFVSIILLLSYGTYQNTRIENENERYDLDSIDVSFKDETHTNQEITAFLNDLSDDLLGEIKAVCYFPELDVKGEAYPFAFRLEYNKKTKRFINYSVASENSSLYIGRNPTDKEFENGEGYIVIPYDYEDVDLESKLGKTVHLDGKTYKVIGISFLDDYKVSYYNAPDGLKNIDSLYFMPDNMISRSAYTELEKKLTKHFGDGYELPEIDVYDDNVPYYNTIMLICIGISFAGAFLLMVLFRYIVRTRIQTIGIFRLCGAKKSEIIFIFIGEIVITSIASALLGAGCFFGIIVPYISKYYVYIGRIYTAKNIAVMSLIYILSVIAFMYIMLMPLINKDSKLKGL